MAISSNGLAGLKPGVVDSTATRPSSPFEGQIIFQKDTDQLLVWNGSAWVIPNQTTQNPGGLELVKTQTIGTTVSSVTVTDAFSSTYDNYKIMANSTASTQQSLSIRLGSSTTGYYSFLIYGDGGGNTLYGYAVNNDSWFAYIGGASGASRPSTTSVDILNPYATSFSRIVNAPYQDTNSIGTINAEHRVATSYTDFTLYPATGTFSGGTVSVYGYRK
jgi:hypothetical protein